MTIGMMQKGITVSTLSFSNHFPSVLFPSLFYHLMTTSPCCFGLALVVIVCELLSYLISRLISVWTSELPYIKASVITWLAWLERRGPSQGKQKGDWKVYRLPSEIEITTERIFSIGGLNDNLVFIKSIFRATPSVSDGVSKHLLKELVHWWKSCFFLASCSGCHIRLLGVSTYPTNFNRVGCCYLSNWYMTEWNPWGKSPACKNVDVDDLFSFNVIALV